MQLVQKPENQRPLPLAGEEVAVAVVEVAAVITAGGAVPATGVGVIAETISDQRTKSC